MSALITVHSHPLLRVWGIVAAIVALLLLLRGAWLPALALFLLSPAQVMLFAPTCPDSGRITLSWLCAVLLPLIALAALFAIVVEMGGIPPMHEWVRR